MAGLFEQYDNPAFAGNLAMGAGLLESAGPQLRPVSLGQALARGLMSGQGASTEAAMNKRRNALVDIQMQQQMLLMEQAARQRKEEAEARALMQQFMQTPQTQAASMPGGPTQANAAMIPQMPGGFNAPGMQDAAMRAGNLRGVELAQSLAPKPQAPIKLGEGDQLFDPTSYKPLAKNPKAPDINKPFLSGPNGEIMPNPGYQQYELQKARAGASNVSVNTGQKGFDNALKLRGDFRSEPIYKAHQDVMSAHAQIRAAIRQASPAGDLAAATKLMKILDPGSVVRESELGMAMAASGLMDRVMNYGTMMMRGEKLTPTQREDFGRLADALVAESNAQFQRKRAEYDELAGTIQIDPRLVTGGGPAEVANPAAHQGVTYRYNAATGRLEKAQ